MLHVVGVAGTFGPLHIGHKALLQKAFEVGKKVLIALTIESMLKNKTCRDKIPDYELRKIALQRFLDAAGYKGRYEIIPLDDPYGVAITLPEQQGIVTSEETVKAAEEINRIRLKRGLKSLKIFTVKLVAAEDGLPISSTRIRKSEIDSEGHSIK
jgi:pantetheine-phosphate adenylyltransferase